MSDETKADELRVIAVPQNGVTVWAVDVYYGCQQVRRIGTTSNKLQAVRTAFDMADKLDVDEINVMGRW